jgi:hypothetical protein
MVFVVPYRHPPTDTELGSDASGHRSITGHERTPNAGIIGRLIIGGQVRNDRLGLSQ